MKNNSFFANLHPDGGHNLPTDLQFAQAVVFAMLSKFNSLVDISFHRSSHICASGSLALQEAFNSISKSAGSLSVWLARPNFNLLYKASLDILGPNSSRSQFASFRQNLAGLHFVFGSDNEHAIKAFLTKLTSSTMGFLRKEVERHHGLPVLSLAAALVPSFDNKSSRALANSLTIASTGEQINGQSLSEDYYNVCATLASPNIGWKGDAIEPKTGIKFPTFLMENFSLTTKVLVGIGSRSMRILSLKSLKPYAFGLYVHPGSICDKLGSKYASVPVEELKNRSDFLEDLLREDIHMTVRLVVNCNGIKINNVKDAFEKSLRTRLQKMNPSTDFHCVMVFGSHFTQDIALPVGTTIDFRQTADGQLITEIAGRQVGAVHSKDLCRAFFDMYIGDLPVSVQAKEEIAENVAGLIRRC